MNESQRFRLYSRLIGAAVPLIRLIIIGGIVVIAMAYFRDIMVAFAGTKTEASVVIKFLLSMSADRWIAYIFGGGGIAYGVHQRRLRRRNIKRLTGKKTELERRMDPGRSSSGLTETGKTRPEDR